MSEAKVKTGYASIDRPWMQFYPDMLMNMIKYEKITLRQYMEKSVRDMDAVAINYYGTTKTFRQVFDEADRAAKALKAIGFKKRDQIPCFFHFVPEFISLLLAAEKIGASLLCRDNTLSENAEAVGKSGAKVMFAHTYLSQSDLSTYVYAAGVKKVILLDPLHGTNPEEVPDYILKNLDTYYHGRPAEGPMTMTYDQFLAMGDAYVGEVEASENIERPLFRCYTSGSTGPSKQVIHSATNMVGVLSQMNFWAAGGAERPRWMTAALPPALVAVVVCMMVLPMASDNITYFSPYCAPTDVDLEFMRIRPNGWAMVPYFCEVVMRSKRIPEDFDASFFNSPGAGSEALNNKQLENLYAWCEKHHVPGRVTCGYGSSEAGTNVTMPMAPYKYGNGMVNVPMPLSVVSVFKPGTTEELKYGEVGELCKKGPGVMLGYDDPEMTAKVIRRHPDGDLWLHMGDIGRMDENGVIYMMTRGESPRFGGGDLWIQPMENKVADAKIEGIDDLFFVNVPDKDHQSYFLPYMYVVLKDGYTVADIRGQVDAALERHERPVEILQIDQRPYFHFKTNRIGLSKEILQRTYMEK